MPVFHAGEQALQALHGQRERLAEVGPRVLRPAMPDAHRAFFAELPWLLAAAVDAQGQPWVSALCGAPGFVHSLQPEVLAIQASPSRYDPLYACLHDGARIGLLGLQPHTRRRNRVNGRVQALRPEGLRVTVGQSFGNCPKYITPRVLQPVPALLAELGAQAQTVPELARATETAGAAQAGSLALSRQETLGERARRLLAQADTCFIASAHPHDDGEAAHGVDVSHRGGPAGFVRVLDAQRLWLPDYAGNLYFNTLGNLWLNDRVGLLWLDFQTGDMLWVAARAQLRHPEQAASQAQQDARGVLLQVHEVRYAPAVLGVREVSA